MSSLAEMKSYELTFYEHILKPHSPVADVVTGFYDPKKPGFYPIPSIVAHYHKGIPSVVKCYDPEQCLEQRAELERTNRIKQPARINDRSYHEIYTPVVTYTLPYKSFWEMYKNKDDLPLIKEMIEQIVNLSDSAQIVPVTGETHPPKKDFMSNLRGILRPANKPYVVKRMGNDPIAMEYRL